MVQRCNKKELSKLVSVKFRRGNLKLSDPSLGGNLNGIFLIRLKRSFVGKSAKQNENTLLV